MSEVTFEEWITTTSLPSTAKEQLTGVLSQKTKEKLIKRCDAERIISSAIEDINYGSVEPSDTIITNKLR